MALDNLTYVIPKELVSQIKTFIYVLQGLGIFIILYIIFSMVNSILNHKKKYELTKISKLLEEIRNYLFYDYQRTQQQNTTNQYSSSLNSL